MSAKPNVFELGRVQPILCKTHGVFTTVDNIHTPAYALGRQLKLVLICENPWLKTPSSRAAIFAPFSDQRSFAFLERQGTPAREQFAALRSLREA